MELFGFNIKKALMFSQNKTFLMFQEKKIPPKFLIFQETETLKKLLIISNFELEK